MIERVDAFGRGVQRHAVEVFAEQFGDLGAGWVVLFDFHGALSMHRFV